MVFTALRLLQFRSILTLKFIYHSVIANKKIKHHRFQISFFHNLLAKLNVIVRCMLASSSLTSFGGFTNHFVIELFLKTILTLLLVLLGFCMFQFEVVF